MVPTSDCFTDNIKLIMLQNTVAGISELNQVKVQSSHDIAHGKGHLTYEKYKTLLLSAASTYDAKCGLTKGKLRRTINQHDVSPDFIDDYNTSTLMSYGTNLHDIADNDNDITYDIDTDFSSLQIHQTDRNLQSF